VRSIEKRFFFFLRPIVHQLGVVYRNTFLMRPIVHQLR